MLHDLPGITCLVLQLVNLEVKIHLSLVSVRLILYVEFWACLSWISFYSVNRKDSKYFTASLLTAVY